jgi:AcrR family transcriptional regulator
MAKTHPEKEGLRERKRRETLHRITETGLKQFIANGYEETTLEAIAAASGISRRTFFYYFKSKEEILLAWQAGWGESLRAAVMMESSDQPPLDAVRNALLRVVSRYATDEMIAIDRLMRTTETLRARKQATYAQQEQILFSALCERWSEPGRQASLRLVAMVSIGVMRIAIEKWGQDGCAGQLKDYLKDVFADLKYVMSSA